MKAIFNTIILMTLLTGITSAQEPMQIPLYEGLIPGAKSVPADYKEQTLVGSDGVSRVSKVSVPTLSLFLPAKGKSNGTAVIICPGGGYGILAFDKEGTVVAKKFAEMGITAFVLKYRLPSDAIMLDKSTAPLQDALQAIHLVRENAGLWGLSRNKIGIMGFSAGGHLAASASVHYNGTKIQQEEGRNLRPDFSILIYPVISFGTVTHAGSVKNLLGDQPTQSQRSYFSTQNHVNANTPPAFLVHANDDAAVPVKNSLLYSEALVKSKVPNELHTYQSGGHGFGTRINWFPLLFDWMRANSWL